jgi:hypothetical protein
MVVGGDVECGEKKIMMCFGSYASVFLFSNPPF